MAKLMKNAMVRGRVQVGNEWLTIEHTGTKNIYTLEKGAVPMEDVKNVCVSSQASKRSDHTSVPVSGVYTNTDYMSMPVIMTYKRGKKVEVFRTTNRFAVDEKGFMHPLHLLSRV